MAFTLSSMSPITLGATVYAATRFQFMPNVISVLQKHSGLPYPAIGALTSAAPGLTFTMLLADAVAGIGAQIAYLSAFSWMNEIWASGLKGTTGTAWSLATGAKALSYITGITARKDGLAFAECAAIFTSADGVTHPIIETATVALPTVGAQPGLNTVGPISLSGTKVQGAIAISYAHNAQFAVETVDGMPYPIVVGYMGGEQTITVEHEDSLSLLAALTPTVAAGVVGAAVGVSPTTAYFRGLDPTTQLPVATGISLAMAAGRMDPGPAVGEQGQPLKASMVAKAFSTTSASAITIATGAAVP